ncbi:MAG TPA: hypothetical protein EYQ20_22135 [candidate division Zixibacteria bacterium]|nr:hypothetical protein [candidate division Zixibacteria bacterium]
MMNREGTITDRAILDRVMAFGILPKVVVIHEGGRFVVAMDSITQVEIAILHPGMANAMVSSAAWR